MDVALILQELKNMIGKVLVVVNKTDSTDINALTTKLTLNPNPVLLPNGFFFILIIATLTCN